MEKRNTFFIDKYPQEYEAIREKQKQEKEEALKIFGNYLITITNVCFEKCIKTDKIYFAKSENQCLEACHKKMHALYNHTFSKFYHEENFSLQRATDYGDMYDFRSYIKYRTENLHRKGNKNKRANISSNNESYKIIFPDKMINKDNEKNAHTV